MKRVFAVSVLLLCAVPLALAQNVSSSVRATVLDSTGSAVPGAECTLINQNTVAVMTVKSETHTAESDRARDRLGGLIQEYERAA